jgi:hypothetical protein
MPIIKRKSLMLKQIVAMREAALVTNGQQENTQLPLINEAQANYPSR